LGLLIREAKLKTSQIVHVGGPINTKNCATVGQNLTFQQLKLTIHSSSSYPQKEKKH